MLLHVPQGIVFSFNRSMSSVHMEQIKKILDIPVLSGRVFSGFTDTTAIFIHNLILDYIEKIKILDTVLSVIKNLIKFRRTVYTTIINNKRYGIQYWTERYWDENDWKTRDSFPMYPVLYQRGHVQNLHNDRQHQYDDMYMGHVLSAYWSPEGSIHDPRQL